jgi:hypothetical protein
MRVRVWRVSGDFRILFVRSFLELDDNSTFSFRSLVSYVQLLVKYSMCLGVLWHNLTVYLLL